MFRDPFHKDVFKAVIILMVILVGCRFTMGGMAAAVALAGAVFAIQKKPGLLAVCYIMFPFFTIFNRVITGLGPVFLMTARLGNLFMIAVMILTGSAFQSGGRREKLPITWLFVYCAVACLSSLGGWMPLISYLKIAQFILFLMGLLFVTKQLQQSDKGLYQLRCAFMALAIIMIAGSAASYFFPSIGFSMQIANSAAYNVTLTAEDIKASEGMMLFSGMTHHSQMLAPTIAMMATWVLCDMLLVVKKVSSLHMVLLALSPILLFLSRSRGGLLELVGTVGITLFVCVPRARLAQTVKNKLMQMMILATALLVAVGIVAQIRNQAISKWLRKTEDVGGDTRSLKDAFTGSRQALVEYNLRDFRRNPFLGMGFQVMEGMEQAYRANMITWYSASIEKGVTPYVILGETGLCGATIFLIFLAAFYGTCLKRRYLALLTSFTCVLVANLADSTLFSPGGLGGFLWITSCVGAFGTDLIAIRQTHGLWCGPGGGNRPQPPPMGGMPPPPPRNSGWAPRPVPVGNRGILAIGRTQTS